MQPRCTLVVSLSTDPEEHLKILPKDTRYGVRRAGRESVQTTVSTGITEDLEDFLTLLEETAERQHFALRPRSYYREFMQDMPAHLILGRHVEKPAAGAIILTYGEEAYYLYGASAVDKENLYAPYLTQWEAMNTARREGAMRYDMWGVPCEPHEGHPLWGVYQFKKKFGGELVKYAGAYDSHLSPLRSRMASLGIRGYYALQKFRGKSPGPLRD